MPVPPCGFMFSSEICCVAWERLPFNLWALPTWMTLQVRTTHLSISVMFAHLFGKPGSWFGPFHPIGKPISLFNLCISEVLGRFECWRHISWKDLLGNQHCTKNKTKQKTELTSNVWPCGGGLKGVNFHSLFSGSVSPAEPFPCLHIHLFYTCFQALEISFNFNLKHHFYLFKALLFFLRETQGILT